MIRVFNFLTAAERNAFLYKINTLSKDNEIKPKINVNGTKLEIDFLGDMIFENLILSEHSKVYGQVL